jgi:transcriptional regulator with XRE-family HTH domain
MERIPAINMKRVGENIKQLMKKNGYRVKDLQEMLLLSHPQPIYRWIQGKVLPSIERLYAMSKIFGVHMEELLEGEEVPGVKSISTTDGQAKVPSYNHEKEPIHHPDTIYEIEIIQEEALISNKDIISMITFVNDTSVSFAITISRVCQILWVRRLIYYANSACLTKGFNLKSSVESD